MALVSGSLSTVTADPTAVSVVQVSVQGPRTAGTGVQTHESKNVAVSGGVFSHEIAPGPATLTMVVGQQPGPPIPILVGDVESQTLADVVNAARLASGETQESLAQFVQQVLSARSDVLDAVAGFGQVEEDALTAIGDARSGALSAIGAEVDRAEDAADRAESAVIDGVADGAVTVAKLAQDVKDTILGKADLIGGKVPTSQIPEVALTKPFSVASRAALLALDVQEGDIGIITAGADKGTYILGTGPANVFSSWVQLAVSADAPVSSVNGQTGTVVLNAANVGAAPTTHQHISEQISDSTFDPIGWKIVRRDGNGDFYVNYPLNANFPASKGYVDSRTFAIARQEVQGTNGVTIFEKYGNVVHVASAGTHAGVTIPTDFRPTQIRRVAASTGTTNVGICTLNTDGSIVGGWAAGSAFSYLIQ